MEKEFIKYLKDITNREEFNQKKSDKLFKKLEREFKVKKSFSILDTVSISFLGLGLLVFGYVLFSTISRENSYKYVAQVQDTLQNEIYVDSQDVSFFDNINSDLDSLLSDSLN